MPPKRAGSYHRGVRVLIVEDEPFMAEAIRHGLRLEAIAADIAGDGSAALKLLHINTYDIAVLDRDIPGPTGDEIAERIVASGSGMPILMLTAADRLDDKATGFELGAAHSLPKPRGPAGAPTPARGCASSRACGWIRSAARSTATAATSR